MGERILVVGGAGYIGSITSRLLTDEGYEPIIFDNFANGNEWAVDGLQVIQGDLRNIADISAALKDTQPNAVVHFAALKAAGESMVVPEEFYETNVGGSANLFKAMVQNNVTKLVFSSTAAVYGTPKSPQVNEDHPLGPENAYGHSKAMVEEMLSWLAKLNRLSSIRLRYFNVAGAMADGTLGEAGKKVLNIMPILMEVAAGKRESFTMHGDDFDTPDGTCIRDYIHVVDLAESHIFALKKLESFVGTDLYNVGVGRGYSNKEVVETVKRITKVDFKVEIGPRRVGDPAAYFADNAKIVSELGWKPQFSLDDIVQHAWAWEQTRKLQNV